MSKNMHLIYFPLLNSLYFAIYQHIKCSLRFLQGNRYKKDFVKFEILNLRLIQQ